MSFNFKEQFYSFAWKILKHVFEQCTFNILVEYTHTFLQKNQQLNKKITIHFI